MFTASSSGATPFPILSNVLLKAEDGKLAVARDGS